MAFSALSRRDEEVSDHDCGLPFTRLGRYVNEGDFVPDFDCCTLVACKFVSSSCERTVRSGIALLTAITPATIAARTDAGEMYLFGVKRQCASSIDSFKIDVNPTTGPTTTGDRRTAMIQFFDVLDIIRSSSPSRLKA